MLRIACLIVACGLVLPAVGQNFSEQKVGHIYYISVPDYMTKAFDINDAASCQYQNVEKEAYAIVIDDSKEDLSSLDMTFSGPRHFFDDFIKDYQAEAEQRQVSTPKEFQQNGIKFLQAEMSYVFEGTGIFMIITIAETKTHFYKILTWTLSDNKQTLQSDLSRIAVTLREGQ